MVLSCLSWVFVLTLFLSGTFYGVLVLSMYRALGRVRIGRAKTYPLPSVSVLISARNEEKNLKKLLEGLLAQDYAGHFDVWVADDRSTDSTPEILAEYEKNYPEKIHVETVSDLPPGISPKKNALSKLFALSSGEILLLTDADCRVPPKWISSIILEFEPGIDFVAGNSYLKVSKGKSSALLFMQAVETMSYRIAGTAGLALRIPLTSTGNNLAYRRSFFERVGGFSRVEHIQSGDDDLLMQKAANNPWVMRYAISKDSLVETDGKETFGELWEQRKRWASKTIYYTPRTIFILGGVFLFFLCLTLSPIVSAFSFLALLASLLMFIFKLCADLLLFHRGLRLFSQEHLFNWFIPVEIFHAPFTVFAVLFGVLGKFRWKT